MNYVKIGYLGKTHGVKGELKLKLDDAFIDDFNNADVVFVKVRGHHAPFFIESIRGTDNPIIKFEDTDSKEEASLIQHKPLLLKESDIEIFEEADAIELVYQHCIGFTIVDSILGPLGQIKTIESYPQQEMAVIGYNNKEVLIPMNQYIITTIDETNKTVEVTLPEGILKI